MQINQYRSDRYAGMRRNNDIVHDLLPCVNCIEQFQSSERKKNEEGNEDKWSRKKLTSGERVNERNSICPDYLWRGRGINRKIESWWNISALCVVTCVLLEYTTWVLYINLSYCTSGCSPVITHTLFFIPYSARSISRYMCHGIIYTCVCIVLIVRMKSASSHQHTMTHMDAFNAARPRSSLDSLLSSFRGVYIAHSRFLWNLDADCFCCLQNGASAMSVFHKDFVPRLLQAEAQFSTLNLTGRIPGPRYEDFEWVYSLLIS